MERQYHSAFSSVVNYLNIPPYLYRYENQLYIDKFFESGELMISSFHQYSQYDDNQLGDKSEGSSINFGITDNNKTVVTVTGVGSNAHCFCTSTILKKDLFDVFKRDSVFRIKDPINFMIEVEKSLTRVREVLFGNCIYLDKRSITKNIPSVDIDKMSENGNGIPMDKMMQAISPLNGPEQYFLKILLHQDQNEYRLIWNTDQNISDSLIINCPNARKYCEKVTI